MKKVERGRISIMRNHGDGIHTIEVYFENLKGQTVLFATITPEEFCKAVTGLGHRPCEITTYHKDEDDK